MNLTALQHSPFLQSLGWAIANSLWQAVLLYITYFLINGVYKNASSRFKTNAGTLLLFSAFTWFGFTFFGKYFSIESKAVNVFATQINYDTHLATHATSNNLWYAVLNSISAALPYLSIAYLLLLIFLSIKMISSYRFTNFIKTNGLQKPSAEWKLFTERVSRHIGISKNIKLWLSHHVDVPATIGFFKPVILIPVASINQLSQQQLEAIILHELAHIKRNDFLLNIIISLIETVLFFNPFIVLLIGKIKSERENCCDDFVIQYQYDRHSYASALVCLEQSRNTNLRLAITATSGKKQLLQRIKRIMEVKNYTGFNYGQKLLALLLITGIFCSIAWLSPADETGHQYISLKENKSSANKIIKEILQPVNLTEINFKQPAVTALSKRSSTIVTTAPPSLQKIIAEGQHAKQLSTSTAKEKFDEENADNLIENNFENPTSSPEVNKSIQEVKKNLTFTATSNNFKKETLLALETAMKQGLLKKYFDFESIQSEVKKAIVGLKKNQSPANINKTIKAEQLLKLFSTSLNYFDPKRNSSSIPKNIVCLEDSFKNHVKRTAINFKPESLKILNRNRTNDEAMVGPPAPKKLEYAFTFKNRTEPGAPPLPEIKTAKIVRQNKNRIEIHNGEVIINGNKLNLSDINNISAQFKKRRNSVLSPDENIIEIHIND